MRSEDLHYHSVFAKNLHAIKTGYFAQTDEPKSSSDNLSANPHTQHSEDDGACFREEVSRGLQNKTPEGLFGSFKIKVYFSLIVSSLETEPLQSMSKAPGIVVH